MKENIILFKDKERIYNHLAEEKAKKEDYTTALGFLLKSAKVTKDCDVYAKIADIYTDMGLLEYANKYWFKYMSVAPKDKVSVAYEELAINFFYMENLWASGYYFHLKLSTDGFISKEGIDQEILDFFSGEEIKKSAYRVVYPHDKADYSPEIKNGKRAIAVGGFSEGAKILSTIPEDMRTTEISGDLAIALFMDERLDEAEKVCRDDIERNGESVTAYCNLSTIYDMKEDFDKSIFYYNKALIVSKGEEGDAYRIATCAIEREDHPTVVKCLDIILADRPYDVSMRFFRGIAKINLKDYDGGLADLKFACRTDPTDMTVKFYIDFIRRVKANNSEDEKLIPLKYVKEIPDSYGERYKKEISKLIKQPENIKKFIKNKDNIFKLIWGMYSGDDQIMRESVYIMSLADEREFTKIALSILCDPECNEHLKRVIIYALIVKGYKGKMGIVAGTFFIEFRPKKLKCEKDEDGILYFTAYGLCASKMLFYDIENIDKIGTVCDKIFTKFKGVITEAEVTNEEICALILYECKFKRYSDKAMVKEIFDINEKKLDLLITLYEGESYSKKKKKEDK